MNRPTCLALLIALPMLLVALAPPAAATGLCRETFDRYSSGTTQTTRTCTVTVNEGGYLACYGYAYTKRDYTAESGKNDTESERCEQGV